jgi:hypothetical protein
MFGMDDRLVLWGRFMSFYPYSSSGTDWLISFVETMAILGGGVSLYRECARLNFVKRGKVSGERAEQESVLPMTVYEACFLFAERG